LRLVLGKRIWVEMYWLRWVRITADSCQQGGIERLAFYSAQRRE